MSRPTPIFLIPWSAGCILLFGILYKSATSNEINETSTILLNTTTQPGEAQLELEETENFQADLSVLLPANYVPYQLPVVDSAQFIPVFVSIFITAVADIDENNGQIALDTHFARRWLDYKISKRFNGPLKNITLGPEALGRIWKPDIYFDGTTPMDKDKAEATQKNVKVLFNTKDLKDAQIAFSERTRLKLDCSMEFHYYPADTQTCTYNLRSFSYKQNRLKLFWETPNSIFVQDPSHPNFDMLVESVWPNVKVNGSNKLFVEEAFDPFRKGNYSALTFTIKARRKLSYHLVQTYLPSVLLVLMTWLCFLLPANMVEARIGISMTTVLTLTAMFASVRWDKNLEKEQAPSVSYTMAIDIWMVFCIFTVFLSLFLFTFTYWVTKEHSKNKENVDHLDVPDQLPPLRVANGAKGRKHPHGGVLGLIMYYAFFVFALTFVIFVSGYWWWLLTFSEYFGWDPKQEFNAVDDVVADKESSHFYRYLVEDSVHLFSAAVYPPAARDMLKNVFGLGH